MSNQTQHYGDLVVTLTSAYDDRWNDRGSGANRDGGFWHPQPQGHLCALGSVAVDHYRDLPNEWAVMLVGDNPAKRVEGKGPAVQRPVDYQALWNDHGSGAKRDGSFWRPVPPAGYVSLGDVAWWNYDKPDLDQVWCLRNDLVNDGDYKTDSVWDDKASGAKADGSFWEIVPNVKNSASKYIPALAGTFRCNFGYDKPDPSHARVPALYVPKHDKPLPVRPPSVTPDEIPEVGDSFSETVQSEVTLPFTSFFDPSDRACLDNIENPFCSVSKTLSWTVQERRSNFQTSPEKYTFSTTTGMTTNETKSTTETNGVTVKAEVGCELDKYSISLNYQFSYSQSNSVEKLTQDVVSSEITIPPNTIALFWVRRVSIEGVRADGSRIGSVISYNAHEAAVSDVVLSA